MENKHGWNWLDSTGKRAGEDGRYNEDESFEWVFKISLGERVS
jgi:hypothetical protein